MLMISLAPCTVLPPLPTGALASTRTLAPACAADTAARLAAPPPPTTTTSAEATSTAKPSASRLVISSILSPSLSGSGPQRAADDVALYLVGAAEDLEHLGFAEMALHRVFHRVAVRA